MKVKIKKLHEDAIIPIYGTSGSSCVDLYVIEGYYLNPGNVVLLHTGFAIELPEDYEAVIRPRSSAIKSQIIMLNSPGTIDNDYRGEILIGVKNIGDSAVIIKKHERVAQMSIRKFEKIEFEEVDELSDTKRGSGRMGSTGK